MRRKKKQKQKTKHSLINKIQQRGWQTSEFCSWASHLLLLPISSFIERERLQHLCLKQMTEERRFLKGVPSMRLGLWKWDAGLHLAYSCITSKCKQHPFYHVPVCGSRWNGVSVWVSAHFLRWPYRCGQSLEWHCPCELWINQGKKRDHSENWFGVDYRSEVFSPNKG